jgi:hypothetical protein
MTALHEKKRRTVLAPIRRTAAPAGTYNDEQWEAIAASLARIGIDADITVTPDWTAFSQPLAKVLQDLSRAFAEMRAQSPHRLWQPMITDMRQAMAALKAAHAIFARYLNTEVETIDAELMPVIAKTQLRLDRLLADWGRPTNARKLHIDYWSRLSRLWQQIIVEHTPTRRPLRKDLIEFLRACSSASFAAMATESALKNFLDRHRPHTKR